MAGFEDQLKQLEAVVDKLENGDLTLEESLKLFEQGMALSDECKKQLEAAEGKIQILLQQRNGTRKVEEMELDGR